MYLCVQDGSRPKPSSSLSLYNIYVVRTPFCDNFLIKIYFQQFKHNSPMPIRHSDEENATVGIKN